MLTWSMFFDIKVLISGLSIGLLFGFLLQRGHVTKFDVIIGQFLLRDFTALKIMLTAIIVGGIGVYSGLHFGLIYELKINSAAIGFIIVGGAIFALGMTILGFCPGTCVAAAGEGNQVAGWGIVGMLCGAFIFEYIGPMIFTYIPKIFILKKLRLVELFGMHQFLILFILTICVIGIFVGLEKYGK